VHLERVCELLSSHVELRGWMCVMQMLYVYVGRWGLASSMRRLAGLLVQMGSDETPFVRGRALALRAWLALWEADLPLARELADEAQADARWLGNVAAIELPLQLLKALDSQLSGDSAGMSEVLTELCQQARKSPQRRSELLYTNFLGAFAAANGDWGAAREVLATMLERQHLYDWNAVRLGACTLDAEISLNDGDVVRALAVFREFGPGAIDRNLWGLHARVCAGWARAELRGGDTAAAWRALSPALQMAVDAGEVLGLLLCGPKALDELAIVAWSADADPPEVAMLRRCAEKARRLRSGAAEPAPPAAAEASRLSKREIEVLQLISQGQSNKQIARALDLSPHTVKRHVARILERTGQRSRGQAAAWLAAILVQPCS